jgi:hypothetical protein
MKLLLTHRLFVIGKAETLTQFTDYEPADLSRNKHALMACEFSALVSNETDVASVKGDAMAPDMELASTYCS